MAEDERSAHRRALLIQKDQYFDALFGAGDDAEIMECYQSMIQKIDAELNRIGYLDSIPSMSSLGSSLSSSTLSANATSRVIGIQK
jgi:NAD(P)H-hydrate repair Nnr-like enzyme with NAD(P)H-hydrate epimerase domain